MGPNYPTYPSQPNKGALPSMIQMGPRDLVPSSGTAEYYQGKIDRAHGRYLAGLGGDNMEPEYALNELNVMAELDDVQGDGIFDPSGTQKNINPDAGVFAVNYSLPGYHARERPYGFSEEVDVTTGRRIRAVPNGAVATDNSGQIAFLERGLYPRPSSPIAITGRPVRSRSITNVMQNPEAVKGFDPKNPVFIALGIAAVIGGAFFLLRKKR